MANVTALIAALFVFTIDAAMIEKYDIDVMKAEVCATMKVDCSDVATPIIVISQIMNLTNLTIYYGVRWPGEPYIFLTPSLLPAVLTGTLYHEITHYVTDMVGLELDRCDGEQLARDVEKELTGVYDPTWRVRYECVEEEEK